MSGRPQLSAVVGTDRYGTIARLVEALAAQERPERIELVVVGEADAELDPGPEVARLGSYRTVRVRSIEDLRPARIEGFAAAAADVVLFAETHCLPAADWLDPVLEAHAEGWAVVGPAFDNGNPATAISWAAFMDHYGRFAGEISRGPADEVAGHNATFDRTELLALGQELPALLRDFAELHRRLGGRDAVLLEPAARMAHFNPSFASAWMTEARVGGRVGGAVRSRSWRWWRRLAYAAATPLIVAVELARRLPRLRRARRDAGMPMAAIPLLAVGVSVRCFWEAVAFVAGGGGPTVNAELTRTEINRAECLRPAERPLLDPPTSDRAPAPAIGSRG